MKIRVTKIVSNIGALNFRMLLTMTITLYTSRVVLDVVGVSDFGIYHLVGGLVAVFGFMQGAITSTAQRYFAFELGKNTSGALEHIFRVSMSVTVLVALGVLLVGEVVGVWVLTNKLNIPPDRLDAAAWVFQLMLISAVISLISIPYQALIIAHEEMRIFAYVSIFDAILKLTMALLLAMSSADKLITYSILMLCIALIVAVYYVSFCVKKYPKTKLTWCWDHNLSRNFVSYATWNLWGNLAVVLSVQGTNVLLSMFFGPVVNAARAIALQVVVALSGLFQNIHMAISPQIIKSYAENNLEYMHELIVRGARYNALLALVISVPFLLCTSEILSVWLGTVPEYSAVFVKLLIVNAMIESVSLPLMTGIQAAGKVRAYQLVVGGILLLNIPISYLFLLNGHGPQVTAFVSVVLSSIGLVTRLAFAGELINLRIIVFFQRVLLPYLLLVAIVLVPLSLMQKYLDGLLLICIISFLWSVPIIYLFGLEKDERLAVANVFQKFISVVRNRL